MCAFYRKNERIARAKELQKRLAEMLKVDFPAANECENSAIALQRIRREERHIEIELSALRLLQSEDRLSNNLLIPILASISAIVGALVGYFIKLII